MREETTTIAAGEVEIVSRRSSNTYIVGGLQAPSRTAITFPALTLFLPQAISG
jgi:hypothetical protein